MKKILFVMKMIMAAHKKKITKTSVRSRSAKKVVKKTSLKKRSVKKPIRKTRKLKHRKVLNLERSEENPIITPTENKSWESKATFNPTALYHDGKVHIIYRAIGDDDSSALGYATSRDGYSIDERLPYFVYRRYNNFTESNLFTSPISYVSGGGWNGGCEDPRLTLLEDAVYMLYTAFDGWGSVRIALTSVSLDDFISKRFRWKNPVLISPPGEIHKNWALFPEKIKGKYAVLHSISPEIMIDYFKSLDELDGNNFIHSIHGGSPLWERREKLIRGVGPAPIKTKYGWLILYHKMEAHDSHRYKLWAMILDINDPTKILHRSDQPILEPDLWYENEGHKGGVVYACGAVVKDGELFVYYGGADRVSCVASAPLDHFLNELRHSSVPLLKKKKEILKN